MKILGVEFDVPDTESDFPAYTKHVYCYSDGTGSQESNGYILELKKDYLYFYMRKAFRWKYANSSTELESFAFGMQSGAILDTPEDALIDFYKMYKIIPSEFQNKSLLNELKDIETKYTIKDILE